MSEIKSETKSESETKKEENPRKLLSDARKLLVERPVGE